MNDTPDERDASAEVVDMEDVRAGVAETPASAVGELPNSSDRALVTKPVLGLILALVTGLAVWGAMELILPVFHLPQAIQEISGNASSDQIQLFRDTLKATNDKNAVVALVLLATTLAVVLTVTELLHRRAGPRVVWGGLLAGLIAAVITLGAGAVAIGVHDGLELEGRQLTKTIVVQGAMLGLLGLGVGLGIGLPILRPRVLATCVAGCLIGGMLAALIFPITASTCLPHVNTDVLVPRAGVGRLVWIGMATGLIGLTATGLGKEKQK